MSSEGSSSLALGVFSAGRSSGTSLNGEHDRQTKRRKVSGTNSRFDRMIETMSMTHPSHSPLKTTRRRQSSSIRSACNFTHTPVDSYDGQGTGLLAKDLASITMNAGHTSGPSVTINEPLHGASKVTSTRQDPKPLPAWLSNTLTGLHAQHPLRLLLPKSPRPPPGLVDHSEDINSEDEVVFAFLPADIPQNSVPYHGSTVGYTNLESNNSHPSYSSISAASFSVNSEQCPQLNFSSALAILPFSTPGPGSLLSESRPPVSPTMHTLSHVQIADNIFHDSGLDDKGEDLDFVPFSTPGPKFMSVGNSRPKSPHLRAIPEDPMAVIDPDVPDPIQLSTSGQTSLTTAPTSSLSNNHPSSRPSADPYPLSYLTSMSDTAPGYSSDDIADDNACFDDPFADDSASDPLPDLSAYTQSLPNLFATPGPGYHPRRIYFDSPTEDPSDSDSLQPGYEVDYETLDFHWHPFNRKGSDATKHKDTTPLIPLKHADIDGYVDIKPDRQQIIEAAKRSQSQPLSSPRRILYSSPSTFSVGPQNETYNIAFSHKHSAQQYQKTPESQRHMPLVFAPAPGIFLSPLRDADLPSSLDGSPYEPTKPDVPIVLID